MIPFLVQVNGLRQIHGHVLLLTGSAPYLGGPETWRPPRDAAPEVDFRDLDFLDVEPADDLIGSMTDAIGAAADACALLTPSKALDRFEGPVLFGNGPIDRKARKRIRGSTIDGAWSAPMIEAPHTVAECLYDLRNRK